MPKKQYQENAEKFTENMVKASERYQAIFRTFWEKQSHFTEHQPASVDPFHVGGVIAEAFSRLMAEPDTLIKHQLGLLQGYSDLWNNIATRSINKDEPPLYAPSAKDRRFKDDTWENNPMFDFIRQAYVLNSTWLQNVVKDIKGLDKKEAQKMDFYTRQFLDALSPSNFLMTNPKALKTVLETNGESLVKGLDNLYNDLIRSDNFNISTSDFEAFHVGKNLATTAGKVVYQNDLMQLIQYTPTTKQTHETPLLIIPAWINKFYILDLQQENSFVKYLLDQGYSVFMISWVNPSKKHADKKFEDYMQEGPLTALDVIEEITGSTQTSAIGYCLGGTLLSITLAYLKAHKQDKRINSATFLTTLIDFEEAGELCIFIDDDQLALVEKKMMDEGFYNGREMSYIFSILRANDMIWSFVVNNYMLGKDPFPFDLLYWNADATNLPARTHSFYLRNMYQQNNLAKPNAITFFDTPIDVTKVDTPSYFLSTREDHIAPWDCTYKGTQLFSGKNKFVLSASGHVAGVINPPAKNKYNYWENDKTPKSSEAWLKDAVEREGSWWPNWIEWHKTYAGKKVTPPKVGSKKHPPIEDAPGSYVIPHAK